MHNHTFLDSANAKITRMTGRLLYTCLILACASVAVQAQSYKQAKPDQRSKTATALAEGFYFLMNDYKMEHQGEVNTLNIKLSYEYNAGIADQEYPDFIPIRKDVDAFLREYPNETAFWEIVNKQLTARLLEKYPAIASVTCELQVTPSSKYSFIRGSLVTRHRSRLAEAAPARQNSRRKK
jgi:hypothetical protein